MKVNNLQPMFLTNIKLTMIDLSHHQQNQQNPIEQKNHIPKPPPVAEVKLYPRIVCPSIMPNSQIIEPSIKVPQPNHLLANIPIQI